MDEFGFIAWIFMILPGEYLLAQNNVSCQGRFKDFHSFGRKLLSYHAFTYRFPCVLEMLRAACR